MGPGAYGIKPKYPETSKIQQELSPRKKSKAAAAAGALGGSDDRFKDPRSDSPGPGTYSEVNKWHKKTYNLKFLNVS